MVNNYMHADHKSYQLSESGILRAIKRDKTGPLIRIDAAKYG